MSCVCVNVYVYALCFCVCCLFVLCEHDLCVYGYALCLCVCCLFVLWAGPVCVCECVCACCVFVCVLCKHVPCVCAYPSQIHHELKGPTGPGSALPTRGALCYRSPNLSKVRPAACYSAGSGHDQLTCLCLCPHHTSLSLSPLCGRADLFSLSPHSGRADPLSLSPSLSPHSGRADFLSLSPLQASWPAWQRSPKLQGWWGGGMANVQRVSCAVPYQLLWKTKYIL